MTTEFTIDQLKDILHPGAELTVRFGSRGTQRAQFVRWSVSQVGTWFPVVRKFSAKRKRWIEKVRIHHLDILEVL